MKTTILKSAFFVALTAGLLTSCVKDDDYGTPQLSGCTETSLVKNREVSQITASAIVAQHEDIQAGVPDVIEAYVTSSDIGGNFFKSISFQSTDGNYAFSVPVDATSLFINYQPGRKVLINMDGLYTDIKYGGMRIGGLYANSSGGAEVGRLPEADFRKSVQPSCTIEDEDNIVQHVTVEQAKNDSYLNKLIEFDNVEFSDCDPSATYYDVNNDIGGATNHILTDRSGTSVILRVSSFSNFASKNKATGSGTVRGVMTKYGSDYQFMVRTEGDIKMTGARFKPLLNEGFDGGLTCWTNTAVVGGLLWTLDTTHGNPGSCAKMSGYSGSNQLTEAWLISPSQDLSGYSAASVQFDSAKNFTGNALQLYVSTNYVGFGSPAAATWTAVPASFATSTGYVWTPSNAVNLTPYIGNSNVYIAFKYTSTTSAAATWEVDNVKLTATP